MDVRSVAWGALVCGMVIAGSIVVDARGSSSVAGSHYVHGYARKDGTYVSPHMAANPGQSLHSKKKSRSGGGNCTASSDDMKNVQTALRSQGLYDGPIDGKNGPKTKAGIREFQVKNKLEVTGELDCPLLAQLTAPARRSAMNKPA
jgi:peptidoglycan hydrolase-like protein with peptidoglycan-binding domain